MTTLNAVFQWMLLFIGLYVVVAAAVWIASAVRFALSRELDVEKIQASLRDGVLEMRIPRRSETRPRRIEVSAG